MSVTLGTRADRFWHMGGRVGIWISLVPVQGLGLTQPTVSSCVADLVWSGYSLIESLSLAHREIPGIIPLRLYLQFAHTSNLPQTTFRQKLRIGFYALRALDDTSNFLCGRRSVSSLIHKCM